MSTTWGGLEDQAGAYLDAYAWEDAERVADELVGALPALRPSPDDAHRLLGLYRRKRRFDAMERLARAALAAGVDGPRLRVDLAQALNDQGRYPAAEEVLTALLASRLSLEDRLEATGVLGRTYKQGWIDGGARTGPSQADLFRRALAAYRAGWDAAGADAPRLAGWHGVNLLALQHRGRRAGVDIPGALDDAALARALVEAVERNPDAAVWDLAIALEASLALPGGDPKRWAERYVADPEADFFEYASTARQLRELWGDVVPPGITAQVEARARIAPRPRPELRPEAVFEQEAFRLASWWLTGAQRFRGIAQVVALSGAGIGTGFLLRAKDLNAAWPDRPVLLTNFHVVNRMGVPWGTLAALRPESARLRFEVADGAAAPARLGRQLFESPLEMLDCWIGEIEAPPSSSLTLPIDPTPLPQGPSQAPAYVVGHPGGRALSVSATAQARLVAVSDRFLHYRASTEPGSSGSPVFNEAWEVIALHHAARDTNNDYAYDVNEGISIHAIREAVKAIPWPG